MNLSLTYNFLNWCFQCKIINFGFFNKWSIILYFIFTIF